MKRHFKYIISCVIILSIVITGLHHLSVLTERKSSYYKYEDFYRQEENFDVLFFGTSHMINGIFPMELWNNYGIISYNFGGHANTIATSYWQMINAFDHTTPKLVVFDCNGLAKQNYTAEKDLLHLSFDSIPFSRNKLRAVDDLLRDNNKRIEFLFDFDIYHNRWNELTENDFMPSVSEEKGAESRINVAEPDIFYEIDREKKLEEETLGIQYLKKAIEACQERGIEVLLTYLPFPANEYFQTEANSVYDIADQYSIHYLDFSTLKELVDFDIDCYDANSHLNPSGARKITNYIGKYIIENYDIPDQRSNSAYSGWHEDYSNYTEYKLNLIRQQTSLKTYLMLLSDRNLSYSIYLEADNTLLDDPVIVKLLSNTGIDTAMLSSENASLIIVNRITDSVTCFDGSVPIDTTFGTISITDMEGVKTISVNGQETLKMSDSENSEAGIIVFDHEQKPAIASYFQKISSEFTVVKD